MVQRVTRANGSPYLSVCLSVYFSLALYRSVSLSRSYSLPAGSGTLSASMGLVLEEFYQNIVTASVSAVTGDGIDDLFKKIAEAGQEYHATYRPMMEARLLSFRWVYGWD